MNESLLCTHASKKVMLLKPSQISELILDYASEVYKTDTETVVEEWGYEEVKNDPLVQHNSLGWCSSAKQPLFTQYP
jgi:hypothetical protein